MREFKYVNNELAINIGDVFEHKADSRRMVVIDFDRSPVHANPEIKDKNRPVCRFYNTATNSYKLDSFYFDELIRIEE